jgi:LysM repeat protein
MRTLTVIISILLFSLPALAGDRPTHTVRQGETLFSISRQYDITIDQIREWNGLRDNVIRAGQELIVGNGRQPDRPLETDRRAQPDRQETERPQQRTRGDVIIHTVEPGQTLFRISQIYDVAVDDIRRWNNLRDNIISIGQELEIRRPAETAEQAQPERTRPPDAPREERPPVADRVDTAEQPAEIPDRVPPQQTADTDDDVREPDTPGTYEVRPGDTLYRIASQFNMTVSELMEMNRLESSQIHVGQQLRIRSRPAAPPSVASEWDVESSPQGRFVTHTISDGDSLHQLLQHHSMDMYEFRALNPGVSAGDLRPGDEITLIVAATTKRPNPFRVSARENNGSQLEVTRYPSERQRKTTTSGDLYNPEALTAAHPSLALGSVVYIENPGNGRGIFVHINDRTPDNRLVLSDAAFRALDFQGGGRLLATIRELSDD